MRRLFAAFGPLLSPRSASMERRTKRRLEPGMRCDKSPGASCYLYDSNFMCCTVCPTGC